MWEMMMFYWNWIIAHHMALAPTAEAQGVSTWGACLQSPKLGIHCALGTLTSITFQLPQNFQQGVAGLLSYCPDLHWNSFSPKSILLSLNPNTLGLSSLTQYEIYVDPWSKQLRPGGKIKWYQYDGSLSIHEDGEGSSQYSSGHSFQRVIWHA